MKKIVLLLTVLCMMTISAYALDEEKCKIYDFTADFSQDSADMLGIGVKDGFHVSVIKGKLSTVSTFGIPVSFTLNDRVVNDYDYAIFMLKCVYVDQNSKICVKFKDEDGNEQEVNFNIPDKEFNLYSVKIPDMDVSGMEIFVNSIEPNMDNYTVELDYIRLYKTQIPVMLTIDSTQAIVASERKNLDSAALIRNDFTLTPARFVAESVGADVKWIGEERKVLITKDETVIELVIDSDVARVNGKEIKLDVPACIINDFTYTPARFVAENLGCSVEWEPEHRTVIIS